MIIDDVIYEHAPRFEKYYKKHHSWGSLHVVLDDINLDDESVKFCINWAEENDDKEGEQLALILLAMTPLQRLNLGAYIAGA